MIVDTSALVAIVTGEPGYERLLDAILVDPDPAVPASCLLEAHMVIRSRFPPAMLETLDATVTGLRLRVVPFTEAQSALASAAFDRYGRGRHPAGLNFGDCMAYAAALAEGAPLLFVGEDFSRTDIAAAAQH